MFRIDNSTAAAELPAPSAAGTPGYFTNGDPESSTPPTILEADWCNMIQEELAAILAAAGVALSKANHAQLAAILARWTGGTFTGLVEFSGGSQFNGTDDVGRALFHHPGVIQWYVGGVGDGSSIGIGFIGAGAPFIVIGGDNAGVINGGLNVTGALKMAGATVWTSGNSGPGSGMNADKLDGRHAAEFLLVTDAGNFIPASDAANFLLKTDAATFGSNANGYWEKRANGVIEQWGRVTADHTNEGPVEVVFPISFTDVDSISVSVTARNPAGATPNDNDMWGQYQDPAVDRFNAFYQSPTSGNIGHGFSWRAVGR